MAAGSQGLGKTQQCRNDPHPILRLSSTTCEFRNCYIGTPHGEDKHRKEAGLAIPVRHA